MSRVVACAGMAAFVLAGPVNAQALPFKPDGASPANAASSDTRQDLSREVGKLIADGHCDDAKKLALRHGDLDLAKQVKDYCAPRPMSLGSWWKR